MTSRTYGRHEPCPAVWPWSCGLGMILLLIAHNAAFLVMAGIISGSAHGVLYPCLCTMAVRNESPGLRAKIMAIVTGSIDLGVFVGAILLGQVGKHFGYPAIFLVAGAMFFGGLVIIRIWPLKTHVKNVSAK